MGDEVWDTFINRVIDAQRQLARVTSPHMYRVHVSPYLYSRLEDYLERSTLPVVPDPTLADDQIVLRHEVIA